MQNGVRGEKTVASLLRCNCHDDAELGMKKEPDQANPRHAELPLPGSELHTYTTAHGNAGSLTH